MYRIVRQNKYRAVSTLYKGERYASAKEAEFARELDLRVKAKDIKSWRRQVRIPLEVNGMSICSYRLDFEVTHNNGDIELIEVKGYSTREWQLKWKLLEAIFSKEKPDVKLTIVR